MNFIELENYMKNIDTNIIPDCEIAVYKDHKCLYKNSFSRPNYPVEESEKDLYYLFSASKVITCTAAMRLIEDKKLGIDDPVSKYLPEFAKLYVLKEGQKVPAKNTLTVRHLMSMQGGFTYNLGFEGIKRVREESNNKATTREVVSALADMPLSFEPGENYQYSLCHDILAAVIEVASGKKFSEYLNEVIFSPLGMKDMTFTPNEDVIKRMKRQYRLDLRYFTAVPQEPECVFRLTENHESGGAGMIGSLNDYIKFADALACGGVLFVLEFYMDCICFTVIRAGCTFNGIRCKLAYIALTGHDVFGNDLFLCVINNRFGIIGKESFKCAFSN